MKQSNSLMALVGVAAVSGAGMFFVGRALAPSAPVKMEKTEAAHEDEHEGEAHGEHAEHGDEHGEAHSEAIVFTPQALQSAGVKTAPVTLSPAGGTIPFNGTIEVSPENVARVASVVPGRVLRVNAIIGQAVRRGQVLATVESRSVGEAQSAYRQALARLQNARGHYEVVQKQARAGVFSRGPLDAAQRAHAEAQSAVRTQETAVRGARMALENVTRLAQVGSFARPALEAAQSQQAAAQQSLSAAEAALNNAESSVQAAQAEAERRRQIAASGGYASRPVEEARRVLVAAQAARAAGQSEVATTRANLSRAKSLSAEGLISRRDLEAAQNAFDTAMARLESAQSDEKTAAQELERQQKLAAANVNAAAEVQEALSRVAAAQADERTRRAEVARAREGVKLAAAALAREQKIFDENLANRREVTAARAQLQSAETALAAARRSAALTSATLERETKIFGQNLHAAAQVQSAQAALVTAQSDVQAAQSALSLLKSKPGGSAIVPLRAPLSGVVQERNFAPGEVVTAEQNLMTIVNLGTVHVDMFLPERDIASIKIGAPVTIRVDAVPGRAFAGHIELIHTELAPKTRTIEAHAEIANPVARGNYVLRPGMFARGSIGTSIATGVKSSFALTVPAAAVQELEGKTVVFVEEKPGTFAAREVQTGAASGGKIPIKSGLRPGEKIVVHGAFMVKAQAMKAELGHEH